LLLLLLLRAELGLLRFLPVRSDCASTEARTNISSGELVLAAACSITQTPFSRRAM
jgi:hypothetical protein